jgi:hypothetical protein
MRWRGISAAGLNELRLMWDVRDRDQLGAPTDRTLQRGEVDLPRRVVADHIAYTSG